VYFYFLDILTIFFLYFIQNNQKGKMADFLRRTALFSSKSRVSSSPQTAQFKCDCKQ